MIRLGLCCIFKKAPIKFRTTTVTYCKRIENPRNHLSQIVLDNSEALEQAITYCYNHNIGAFRINSRFLPVCTHPDLLYTIEDLPQRDLIFEKLEKCQKTAKEWDVRLTMHPDQFVVLNSPREDVVEKSIQELEYHGRFCELVGADVINIHGGGAYGNKDFALKQLEAGIKRLSKRVQTRLTLENDDRVYTPEELLPVCKKLKVPLVYDVHHHRCLSDSLSIAQATEEAISTWNREPLFHISSPLEGWKSKKPHLHHDYIDIKDFPDEWRNIDSLTIDVEAKAKELAVEKLYQQLTRHA